MESEALARLSDFFTPSQPYRTAGGIAAGGGGAGIGRGTDSSHPCSLTARWGAASLLWSRVQTLPSTSLHTRMGFISGSPKRAA
jgi:hypothetical protein